MVENLILDEILVCLVQIWASNCVCVCARAHACVRACMHACVRVCVCVCVCVCVWLCTISEKTNDPT